MDKEEIKKKLSPLKRKEIEEIEKKGYSLKKLIVTGETDDPKSFDMFCEILLKRITETELDELDTATLIKFATLAVFDKDDLKKT